MKHAMHGKMDEMVPNRLLLLGCFLRHGFQREHDVAEERRRAWRESGSWLPDRKGQHIGGCIQPAIVAVELLLVGSVAEGNAELDSAPPCQSQGRRAAFQSKFGGAPRKTFGAGT